MDKDGKARVNTSRMELKATWRAVGAKWKIKNVAFAKQRLQDDVDDIKLRWQHHPQVPVIEFLVIDVAACRIAARDTDIGKRASNLEN